MSPRSKLTAALLAALLPSAALATIVIALTVEEMTQRAPLVVRAVAGQSQARWSDDQGSISTYTEFRVTEALKGPGAGPLLVKQPGGVVGPVGQFAVGAARFTPGEDLVLFLEPAPDEKGVFLVQGLSSGKVSLEERLGTRMAVRHLNGLSFAAPGAKAIRAVSDIDELGTADAFLTRVRAAAKGGRR